MRRRTTWGTGQTEPAACDRCCLDPPVGDCQLTSGQPTSGTGAPEVRPPTEDLRPGTSSADRMRRGEGACSGPAPSSPALGGRAAGGGALAGRTGSAEGGIPAGPADPAGDDHHPAGAGADTASFAGGGRHSCRRCEPSGPGEGWLPGLSIPWRESPGSRGVLRLAGDARPGDRADDPAGGPTDLLRPGRSVGGILSEEPTDDPGRGAVRLV